MRKLLVALGNPGSEYDQTRHNIGWMVIDKRISQNSIIKQKFKGIFWEDDRPGLKISYLKPMTFMNLSGQSVAPALAFFKIGITDILVVHDELDLPFGTVAFKKGGGLAGHNGLKSIAKELGSQDFLRLRIGIGRPPHGDVSRWVLSRFSNDEQALLENLILMGNNALDSYLEDGIEHASTHFNKKSINNEG